MSKISRLGEYVCHNFCFFDSVADPSVTNVQVTRMSLICEDAPNPLVLDLQGGSLLEIENAYL